MEFLISNARTRRAKAPKEGSPAKIPLLEGFLKISKIPQKWGISPFFPSEKFSEESQF